MLMGERNCSKVVRVFVAKSETGGEKQGSEKKKSVVRGVQQIFECTRIEEYKECEIPYGGYDRNNIELWRKIKEGQDKKFSNVHAIF